MSFCFICQNNFMPRTLKADNAPSQKLQYSECAALYTCLLSQTIRASSKLPPHEINRECFQCDLRASFLRQYNTRGHENYVHIRIKLEITLQLTQYLFQFRIEKIKIYDNRYYLKYTSCKYNHIYIFITHMSSIIFLQVQKYVNTTRAIKNYIFLLQRTAFPRIFVALIYIYTHKHMQFNQRLDCKQFPPQTTEVTYHLRFLSIIIRKVRKINHY